MKQCTKCRACKADDQFHSNGAGKLRGACKPCEAIRDREKRKPAEVQARREQRAAQKAAREAHKAALRVAREAQKAALKVPEGMKRCYKCAEVKLLENFHRNQSHCKACSAAMSRARLQCPEVKARTRALKKTWKKTDKGREAKRRLARKYYRVDRATMRARSREQYWRNRDARLASACEWRRKNPGYRAGWLERNPGYMEALRDAKRAEKDEKERS
jgi:hypothetical protein